MERYLLTGSAGFIGYHVASNLLETGHEVLGIDNLNDAYDPALKNWRLRQLGDAPGFQFHQIDIMDKAALEEVWGDGTYAAIINLAARAGVRQSVRNPLAYYQSNLLGTLNLLDLARSRQVPKVVQASTSSLYGGHNPRPFKEDTDTSRPLSPYAASKGAAEMLCHTYHQLHDLDISVLRYFTVYGPAGRPEMSVFRFIQWITEERPLILYGDGYQERDFTYVDDIVAGTIAALRPLGFEIINLGSDRPVTLHELIKILEVQIGLKAKIDQREEVPGDIRATWADIEKAQELLRWEPRVPLEDGLKETVAWYLHERSWASQIDTTD